MEGQQLLSLKGEMERETEMGEKRGRECSKSTSVVLITDRV